MLPETSLQLAPSFFCQSHQYYLTEPCLGGVLPHDPCAGFFGVHTKGPVSLCIFIQDQNLDLVFLSQENIPRVAPLYSEAKE
jgi:hypothetical protein